MTCQFLHISLYARNKPAKRKTGRDRAWTIDDIIAEVERVPEHSAHVVSPKTPICIYGISPSKASEIAKLRAEASSDIRGYKVRKDTPIILAGVISYPIPFENSLGQDFSAAYDLWKHDTLLWLEKKYSTNLLSVVEHIDESYPHLHFFAVPEPGKGFNAKKLHDGYVASTDIAVATQKKQLYCDAMRSMQDDYFDTVAVKHGHARSGPKRNRLSRPQWYEEKKSQMQLEQKKNQFQERRSSQKLKTIDAGRRYNFDLEKKITALEVALKKERQDKDALISRHQAAKQLIKDFIETTTAQPDAFAGKNDIYRADSSSIKNN